MKLFINTLIFLLFITHNLFAQSTLTATIHNYSEQYTYAYRCYGDTLLLVDSVKTNAKGKFVFKQFTQQGMYRFNLPRNQWFYILNDGNPIEVETVFQPDFFYNIATDSLKVIKSEENKLFYTFQNLQQQLNVANYFLLQMMRLYPLSDSFHSQLVKEYFERYEAMENFIQNLPGSKTQAGLIAKAYYQPLNPDWREPDPWRDSIIAAHFFDYFNPANDFYLHTNILSEKMENYLQLKTNKKDNYGQPISSDAFLIDAAQEFLDYTEPNYFNFMFCLDFFLNTFSSNNKEIAFISIYDNYLKVDDDDCGTHQEDEFSWARKKADAIRGIQIGSFAPNFNISDNLLLSSIESDYTLVLFWATWCPHCLSEILDIKDIVDGFNKENSNSKLITVAVSLDTDAEQWGKFVNENNLFSFLNFSEFKSWESVVAKQYNVYATPTMFLLDNDKRIIAKPKTPEELRKVLMRE
ncbi:MAG: TlpA disulfide reductase family protein [Bacteroidales bacterium]|nr:TlpA disulfide reductase family protein [Bacteroidales bacterium]